MIGPEQGKKASGKSGKKKSKAKKAKRLAAEIDLVTPTVLADVSTPPEDPASPPDGAAPSDTLPDVGPQLLTWIDRVQERVDHLLTLVDPPSAEPDAAVSAPVVAPEPVADPAEAMPVAAGGDGAGADGDDPAPAADASSLADAWARRQQTAEVAAIDDDEPFEPGDARLTAVLVARELIARGESPADVRRRLREGYGVIDPDAVLAQAAA